jgi:hypothetical protein
MGFAIMLRSIRTDNFTALSYFCIQVDEGSLVPVYTGDGIISDEKPVW